ncbi:MAG: hypothetical protein ACRDKZ_14120 [Actinomycetota bacterium]
MRFSALVVVAGVVASLAAQSGPYPEPGEPDPSLSAGCTQIEDGYRCLYGPYLVEGGESKEVFDYVAAPNETGYITGAGATLVDESGRVVNRHAVHLHHAVWVNFSKQDLICGTGLLSADRFFGTGKERTQLRLPDGYGYYWDNQPGPSMDHSGWGFTAHLDGMHEDHDMNVFVELTLDFDPAEEGALTDVVPVWLDVRECSTDPVYDVPRADARVHRRSVSITMPREGRFFALAGHLHDGGKKLVLSNSTTGEEVFTSRAVYSKRHRWDLRRMTSMSSEEGIAVAAGDELKLTSVYSTRHKMPCGSGPCAWNDVMGIMLGALVPNN